jgi:hypothetical protein
MTLALSSASVCVGRLESNGPAPLLICCAAGLDALSSTGLLLRWPELTIDDNPSPSDYLPPIVSLHTANLSRPHLRHDVIPIGIGL